MRSTEVLVAGALLFASGAEAFLPSLSLAGGRSHASLAPAAASSGRGLLGLSMQAETYSKADIKRLEQTKDLKHLFQGNDAWRAKKTSGDSNYFKDMAGGQTPKYLWIGCSDARVAANEIVGCEPGELFVHRNVANLVVNNDNSLQSVFQYAVEYLQVQHIIVCGHYECGGVGASLDRVDLASPLEEWVCNIRDVYRLHKEELDAIKDPEQRKRRLVELNAKEQAMNVHKAAVVQRRRVYTHMKEGLAHPKVHAVVFDPKTGLLKRINTFEGDDQIDELHEVYDLYDSKTAHEFWEDEEEYPKRENTPRKLFNRMPTGLSAGKKSVPLPASDDK